MVLDVRRFNPKMGGKKLYKLLNSDIQRIDDGIGRDKFFDILRDEGLLVKRKRKYAVTTQSFKRFYEFSDHFNGKTWARPNQAWVCDITYIRVGDAFMYLFLITDAFSRKIVGWSLSKTLETKGAIKALTMALKQATGIKGITHHSDRGFQYCSREYTDLLKEAGALSSMGQAGNCYDNAMAERVNGILKSEYGLDETFRNAETAYAAVKQAVRCYNEQRPHWSLKLEIPAVVHDTACSFLSLNAKVVQRQVQ
jgi:putative transposase